MGELFGPLAAVPDEPAPEYHHEADAIIVGLQRVAARLKAIDPASDAPKGSAAQ